ncbi:MAG: hypothetical protein ACREJG_05315, partial [Candidatus Rokuibacteriota bacterium]
MLRHGFSLISNDSPEVDDVRRWSTLRRGHGVAAGLFAVGAVLAVAGLSVRAAELPVSPAAAVSDDLEGFAQRVAAIEALASDVGVRIGSMVHRAESLWRGVQALAELPRRGEHGRQAPVARQPADPPAPPVIRPAP